MLELSLDPTTYRSMSQFKGKKPAVGTRPLLNFSGTPFDSPVENEYTLAKSVLTDYFRGDSSPDAIDVEGLTYIISFAVEEDDVAGGVGKAPIRMRVYTLRTLRSGARLPRVEVDEVGPRLDLRPVRARHADEAMAKEALKKPRAPTEERTKKNIKTDALGDKVGRVHVGRQDLKNLQTRKMKGLKRSRDVASDAEEEEEVVKEPKKKKA